MATMGNRIALVDVYRGIGPRLKEIDGPGYVRRLNEGRLWRKLMASLGRYSPEVPRGLMPPELEAAEDIEAAILRAADAEALQEGGLKIIRKRIMGVVVSNTVTYAHPQYVVMAEIAAIGDQEPEWGEMLGQVRLCTPEEIRRLCNERVLVDSLTLSALTICGIHIPRNDET